jgi:hypothetical protein
MQLLYHHLLLPAQSRQPEHTSTAQHTHTHTHTHAHMRLPATALDGAATPPPPPCSPAQTPKKGHHSLTPPPPPCSPAQTPKKGHHSLTPPPPSANTKEGHHSLTMTQWGKKRVVAKMENAGARKFAYFLCLSLIGVVAAVLVLIEGRWEGGGLVVQRRQGWWSHRQHKHTHTHTQRERRRRRRRRRRKKGAKETCRFSHDKHVEANTGVGKALSERQLSQHPVQRGICVVVRCATPFTPGVCERKSTRERERRAIRTSRKLVLRRQTIVAGYNDHLHRVAGGSQSRKKAVKANGEGGSRRLCCCCCFVD